MKVGFVGAGKVGCSLGKYLCQHGKEVGGYFSKNPDSAAWAAKFTGTKYYQTLEQVIADNEVIFLTVPDGEIGNVWKAFKQFPLQQKIVCHCSGSISSAIFSDIGHMGAYGCSIHPLFAVNSKENSYKELSKAVFTIEGHPEKTGQLAQLFSSCGNRVLPIDGENKTLYHAAAAVVSNLVNGLLYMGREMFADCGLGREEALQAAAPLIRGNVENVLRDGLAGALTGPVERGDTETVEKHLQVLGNGDRAEIYRLLSKQVLEIAREKHADRDYTKMEELLA